jgi:CheY-like chemotaxis protein
MGSSICILLAEDHDDTRVMMGKLLRKSGFTVIEAKTAAQARSLAASGQCNLLISDLGLPDASGEVLMADLKRMYGLKGIAISGYAMQDQMDSAIAAGFDHFIPKPFDFATLLKVIEKLKA